MSELRAREIEFGVVVKDEAPNDWRQWPERERDRCRIAIERALQLLRQQYGVEWEIVSDASACRLYERQDDPRGRWQLWRRVCVSEVIGP